jgi:hypothetical protein
MECEYGRRVWDLDRRDDRNHRGCWGVAVLVVWVLCLRGNYDHV